MLQHFKIDFDNDFKRNVKAKHDEYVLATINKIFSGNKTEKEIKNAIGIVEKYSVAIGKSSKKNRNASQVVILF